MKWFGTVCVQGLPFPLDGEVTVSAECCALEVQLPAVVWVTPGVVGRLLKVLVAAVAACREKELGLQTYNSNILHLFFFFFLGGGGGGTLPSRRN